MSGLIGAACVVLTLVPVVLLDAQSVCAFAPAAGKGIVALDPPPAVPPPSADPAVPKLDPLLSADTKACQETFLAIKATTGAAFEALQLLTEKDSTTDVAYLPMRCPCE
jgi:hypothetical protein